MKKQFLIGMVAAIAALSGGGAFAASNLVTNGDFANPNVGTGWGLYSSIPGWTSATGATSITDTIEVGGSGNYGLGCANTTGCQNLELNANTFGNVYQTLTGLTAGMTYTVSYLYSGRTGGGLSALDAYFGTQLLTTNSSSVSSWTSNVFNVVATGTSETITFSALATSGNPSYGNEITNVSVTAVPGPVAGSGLFSALGLGAFAFWQLRRRQKTA